MFGAALVAIVLSFLIVMGIITIYAFVLAFQARGAPDQSAINHFAAWISPRLVPWLEMLLTFLVALWVARGAEKAAAAHGLFIGVLAGVLSLALTLPFGGRFDLHNLLFSLIVVLLGWLGGLVGNKEREDMKSSPDL